MDSLFEKQIKKIDDAEILLLKLGEAIAKADDGNVFELDFLAIGAWRRALALLRGFRLLIKDRNFLSAAPLVRLQLDTALRIFAGTLADDPQSFAAEIRDGKPINQIKDCNGQFMRDAYLVDKLSGIYPWVQNVYSQMSGYIHLSEKHIPSAVQYVGDDRCIKFNRGAQEHKDFPLEVYIDTNDAFLTITMVFAKLLGSWLHSKEEVANERKEHTSNDQNKGD